ncbi:glycosyltransferase [Georgenia alba]|uniref:Glycosyltransferase n=1 Tax=Georgenia alba TaxID=2233858 RepID=A0ABW2Q8G6_9MICO
MKVSVVVPTYRPAHLDRVLASLDAQTLPAAEHELILADDGSGPEHVTRLRELTDGRPSTTLLELEHTGWPGHPRNAGLAAAQGEYVLFMDHDDELYPEALAAGYDYARAHDADVLAGKETRTDQAKWGLDVYAANRPDAALPGLRDRHPLLPTNPHKLYRRAFLREHGIRFPEGRRVLWEDVFFNIDVAAHRPRVAVLADVPFYHWVRGGRTASSSYGEDLEEFWAWLEEIFRYTGERLGRDPQDALQHGQMRWYQYRHRMLPNLGAGFFAAPARRRRAAQEIAARILAEQVPPALDAELPVRLRARAHLARAGEWDLLSELVALDAELAGISSADDVSWDETGALRVEATARWTVRGGHRPPLVLDESGRVLLELPAYLKDVLPAELQDVTDDLRAATSSLAVRSRDTGVVWELPTRSEVTVDGTPGGPAEVTVRAVGTLERSSAALGHALEAGVWDVSARNELFGVLNQRGLRTARPARVALVAGETRVAYRTANGLLAVDLGQSTRSLVGSAGLRPAQASTRHRRLGADTFEIPLGDLTAVGAGELEGGVLLQELDAAPATITADPGGGAVLRGSLTARPGRYRMLARFGGRPVDTKTIVTVDARGRLSFEQG